MADWESYQEAAERLGMTADAIRHRARRLAWRRMRANDGKTLVMVPDDVAAIDPPTDQATDQPIIDRSNAGSSTDRSGDQVGTVDILLERVAELRADLERERAEARATLDREREERAKERDRADQLAKELADAGRRVAAIVDDVKAAERGRAEAEQRAAIAEANRTSDQLAADARMDAVRAELQAIIDRQAVEITQEKRYVESFKARPWWRRLAG